MSHDEQQCHLLIYRRLCRARRRKYMCVRVHTKRLSVSLLQLAVIFAKDTSTA